MALRKVPQFGKPQAFVTVDTDATNGAVVGVNLRAENGALIRLEDILNPPPTEAGLEFTYWRLVLEIPPNVVALADTTTTGLYAITGAGTSATREIQPTVGRTTVSNGDGVAGDPVVDLAVVVDSGVGAALMKRTIDSFGRVSGSQAATTDDLPEGLSNLYFTAARVRGTILTGLSLVSSAAIIATDTVLSALGKLQAQISANVTAIAGLVIDSIADADTTHAPSRNAVFDALSLKPDLAGNNDFTGTNQFIGTGYVMRISSGSTGGFRADGYSTNVQYALKRWGGSIGSPSATPLGEIGSFAWSGHDGTAATGSKAYLSVQTTEAWTPTANGTKMDFRTTLTGSTALVSRWEIDGGGNFVPSSDNAYTVGGSGRRPSVLWAASGTISTSDAREKTPVRGLTPAEIAAAKDLAGEIGIYQWLAAIAQKGEAAREHVGMTVQRCIEIMESHGLDAFRKGFVCYDEWDETPEIRDEETGETVQEYRAKGNRYSFRMDELGMFIAAGFHARLAALESE